MKTGGKHSRTDLNSDSALNYEDLLLWDKSVTILREICNSL